MTPLRVLLTGASRGIGEATAYALAKEGCDLLLTYRVGKRNMQAVAKRCKALGGTITLLPLDLTRDASIRAAAKKAGKIDILINNAGAIVWKDTAKQSFGEVSRQMRTNLEGLIKMTIACLPRTKRMVINIASIAGKSAHRQIGPYCATKWGVRGFSQTLALETPVKIVVINPDRTRTRMTDFTGRPVTDVADVIVKVIKGKIKVASGGDVDVQDYA